MKLFVDSGSVKDIEALAATGILDGVTTNPSLLAKEGGDYRQILKRICDIVKGPVSGEVVATDYAGMVRQGRDIAAIDEHMVVKVPLTRDGVKACKTLSSEGMQVVREIVDLFDNASYTTEVLVASVRHPIHVIEAARVGADVVTVPPAVIDACFKHPLTDIGLERFLKDWEKAQGAKV